MADQPEAERRIYVLPPDLLTRLRAYQAAENLPSEVEAVRRLLDTALQLRDTAETILDSLKARQFEERDLKVLAREVVGHALVESVEVKANTLTFRLSTGDIGTIDRNGQMATGDHEQNLSFYRPNLRSPSRPAPVRGDAGPSWDSDKGSDLDDEIPF